MIGLGKPPLGNSADPARIHLYACGRYDKSKEFYLSRNELVFLKISIELELPEPLYNFAYVALVFRNRIAIYKDIIKVDYVEDIHESS